MSDLEQDFLSARDKQPAARPPTTFGEVWSANWDANGLETLTGVGKPAEDAYQDLVKAVEGRIGQPVHEALRDRGVGLGTANTREQRVGMIGALVADLPDEDRKAIEPLMDVRKRAAEKAAATERDAADVNDNTYGLSANAVRFAAGMARQAVDPVNLATLPLGGPLKGPVLPMLGREFLFGAGAQALQTPRIQSGRAELDLESGFARGAGDIFEAGLGNAGFAGLLRGGAAVLRAVRGSVRGRGEVAPLHADDAAPVSENAPADSPAAATGPAFEHRPEVARTLADVAPEDLEAVAHVAERDTALDAQVPHATEADHVRIAAGVEEAAGAIEAGRPIVAYHGSPHSFEAFSLERIGTGEGAQTYGHGLYFAENEAVGREYFKNFNDGKVTVELPTGVADLGQHRTEFMRMAGREISDANGDLALAIEHIKAREALPDLNVFLKDDIRAARTQMEKWQAEGYKIGYQATASIYQARLHTDPEKMLDWDAPAGHQPKAALDLARKLDIDISKMSGKDIYNAIADSLNAAREPPEGRAGVDWDIYAHDKAGRALASEALRQEGVVGLRYLDSGSRGDGAPTRTRNIVLFDDSVIEITHKNGVPLDAPKAPPPALSDLPLPPGTKQPTPEKSAAGGDAPAAKDADAKPPTAGGDAPAAPKQIGDPVIARNAERVLEETGDFEIVLKNPDGTFRKVSARDALREVDDDALAAHEFAECIGGAA